MRLRSMKSFGCLSVSVIAAALLIGSFLPTNSVQAQEVKTGGTLVMARPADIFTFDPVNTQDDRSIFTELTVYDRLVRLSDDGTNVEPELAVEWSVAADGSSADFTLREGVKFSDGSPLTADDVVFSLTRAIDPASSWGFLFSPVKTVVKVDERTIQLQMSEPFAPLLPALSTFAASIYSKANFEAHGDDAGSHPLGTAAFMLDRWEKGNQVVLKRNPNYWQQGKPYLDEVVFKVVGDGNSRVLQLASGDVNLISFIPPNLVEQVESAGGQVQVVKGTAVGFITFNTKIKPLDEASVRCAMAHAIPRDAIAKTVLFGRAAPARSILPSSTFFYDPTVDPVSFDLNRARELLKKSSVPDGFQIVAQVPSGNQTRLLTAQIWADSLAKVGIDMKVELIEETTFQELFNTEKFTLRISAWTNDTPDPDELMGVALDYKPQNGLHSSYRNDKARDLVLQGRGELDVVKRQKIYSELQRIVNQECPFVYTVEEERLYGSSGVNDFSPNSQGKYSFENVWLSDPKG